MERDCGDNSCRYAKNKRGMRTNGGCRCDECDWCGKSTLPGRSHRPWCAVGDLERALATGAKRRTVQR